MQRLFDETGGTHPVFNPLDANNPNADLSTVEAREAGYSMLLSRGVFRRGGAPRAEREWDLVAVDDPHGFANLTRLVHWRRAMPTINFALGSATVNWDGGNSVGTDQRAGLENQARRNITGAQQGPAAPPEVIANIVDFESSLFTAQLIVLGVGRLDSDGARGGPEALATMQKIGRAVRSLRRMGRSRQPAAGADRARPGAVQRRQPRRTQLQRLPQLGKQRHQHERLSCSTFAPRRPRRARRTCRCTRSEPNDRRDPAADRCGSRQRHRGPGATSAASRRRHYARLAARAPYFHNGIAATLEDVVRHYETHLGFIFTDQERADLVAFLRAL